jgi:dUTP pyrophosphatase
MAQETLEVRIKALVPNAVIPTYAKPGDCGMDLTCTSKEWDEEKQKIVFGFGVAFEIPEGYAGFIFPRSSNNKTGLLLSNAVGICDSGYRGEVKAFFTPTGRPVKNYEIGDRVCQMVIMPYPKVTFIDVGSEELSSTERGAGGFGSTGV